GFHPKHRMVRGDVTQPLLTGTRVDLREERADLPLPATQILTQHDGFLVVGQFDDSYVFESTPHSHTGRGRVPEVTDLLRRRAGRVHAALPIERERIERCCA